MELKGVAMVTLRSDGMRGGHQNKDDKTPEKVQIKPKVFGFINTFFAVWKAWWLNE